WTGLFAQAAENTPQHVDRILRRVTLLAVQVLFALPALRGRHGNGCGGTGHGTAATGRTTLPPLFVASQYVLPAPYVTELTLGLGILYRSLLAEKVTQGDLHALKNGRQIDPFGKGHFLLDHNCRSSA